MAAHFDFFCLYKYTHLLERHTHTHARTHAHTHTHTNTHISSHIQRPYSAVVNVSPETSFRVEVAEDHGNTRDYFRGEFQWGKFRSAFESDEVFGVGLRVLEDDEYSGIAEVVDNRVVAELGAVSLRRLLHVRTAGRILARQHATLEHVLGAARVRRRVFLPRRVVEFDREVDAVAVARRCMYATVQSLSEPNATTYRPGGGETICPPRRWQFDPKIAADLRPSADAGPQSAHHWWPAVAKLQAASGL